MISCLSFCLNHSLLADDQSPPIVGALLVLQSAAMDLGNLVVRRYPNRSLLADDQTPPTVGVTRDFKVARVF